MCRGDGVSNKMLVYTRWLVYLYTFILLSCRTLASCPHMCFCNTVSHIVYCSRRGLEFIPSGISSDSKQINLNGNAFTTPYIQRANFSSYPLLEHLYLSECAIEHIEVETFIDLTRLQWLDLSNNRIRVVQDHTFRGLTLMHMFLNGNRNIQLRSRSFAEFRTNGLYLHDCSIRRLSLDVIAPLNNTVKYLWLQGNEIERVERKLRPFFTTLSHIRLGSNPLHCNCETQWLYDFYMDHEPVFEGAATPSCRTPSRLKGRFFTNMTDAEFRCKAPSFHNIDAQFDESHAQLRCSALGDPAPTLYWIQPTGESSRYNPPNDEEARTNEGVLRIYAPSGHEGDLAGMYICVANNAAGNVTLTLNVVWPSRHRGSNELDDGTVEIPSATLAPGQPAGIYPVLPAEPESPSKDGHAPSGSDRPAPNYPLPPNPPTPNDMNDLSDGVKQVSQQERAAINYTSINMLNYHRKGERLFNLTELIGSVIGTLVCTFLLCLILMPIFLKRQWKKRHRTPEKPSSATLYLDGLAPVDPYMDTPAHQKR